MVNICIVKANVKKYPEHVTPLSQYNASAQERQPGLVLGGKNFSWDVTRPTLLHVSARLVLVRLLCARVIHINKVLLPKYPGTGVWDMFG